ncbi:Predicted Zn-dependent peptidase [Frankineae bacterium MT45]|nr:Predicted Zn-dependent peptidase [Frankineae bacterium MT45]
MSPKTAIETSNGVVPALTVPRRAKKLTEGKRTLANGLRVVVVRKPGVPLVEVRLRVPFFSAHPGHSALASVLSDSALTGTSRHDRAGLAGAIQALGGDLGSGVDADRLIFSGSVLATNLVPLLNILADVVTDASYAHSEVKAERERLIERLSIARSRAGVVAAEALAARMWGEHPYARELPYVSEVEAVTAAKVRKLADHSIRPSEAILVVVGDVSPARALDQIEKALDGWTGHPKHKKSLPLPTFTGGPVVLVDRPGSVQSSLRLGGVALRRDDPRFAALQLANLVFGGYFSSRWNENIREDKGYTYGPHSRIEHNQLGSALIFDADVATEVTAPALLETYYELGKLASLPITEKELDSARQYAIGTLALSTATQAGLASTLSGLSASGLDADWIATHPARLLAVTTEEIREVSAEFFAPSKLVTVVVGDAEQVAAPLRVLAEVSNAESPEK